MTYQLAKQLKDGLQLKTCTKCEAKYVGGNKSFRCRTCQKEVRKLMNKLWQNRYYEKNKTVLIPKAVARQTLKYKNDPVYKENNLTKGHRYRSKTKSNGGHHTTQEWIELVEKHNHLCAICGLSKKLTRDHIKPISKGGTNDISNIQPLCGSCNSSKRDKYEPRT